MKVNQMGNGGKKALFQYRGDAARQCIKGRGRALAGMKDAR
jgi:hypothetical protein